MTFEWDEHKRRANIHKHGIDFSDAATIFEGKTVVILDDRFDYGEERYVAFGLLRGAVIKVIALAYAERGEIIRIISDERP